MDRNKNKGRRRTEGPKRVDARTEQPTVAVYGRKPVLELLRHRPAAVEQVYYTASAKFESELTELLSEVAVKEINVEEFDALVGPERNHQGIAAQVRPSEPVSAAEAAARALSSGLPLVLAEQVSDPQNLGALFRTAEALGCAALILTKDRSTAVTPAVRRVSSGAAEFLSFAYVVNVQRTLKELKEAGFWIIGTALGPGSASLYEAELPTPSVVVLGAEGRGLRELTKQSCDLLVQIPMAGVTQSLNVAQAGAVVLSELARRRLAG